jgi:hypothetical protein
MDFLTVREPKNHLSALKSNNICLRNEMKRVPLASVTSASDVVFPLINQFLKNIISLECLKIFEKFVNDYRRPRRQNLASTSRK